MALRRFFGTDRFEFSLTNPDLPGVVRSFESFSQAADEAAVSRIYAGQHFRYDEDAGQALGSKSPSSSPTPCCGQTPADPTTTAACASAHAGVRHEGRRRRGATRSRGAR